MLTNESREQMIEQQVRAWSVLDERVLAVLRAVPREAFVPPEQRFLAFADTDIPLPHAQHMLRPSVAGRLLQALAVGPADRVLEVGTGTGFVTACLARSAAQVQSLEIFPALADTARANLASLHINNAQVATGDAFAPLDVRARYHAIALTGSLPLYDERFQQLLEVGGRLFVVVGEGAAMDARVVRRVAVDQWTSESLFETMLDSLVHAPRSPSFVF